MEVGPLSPTSSVAQIREMAARWKGVDKYRIILAVGTKKVTDYLTLMSAGINREQRVTVVVTPAFDLGLGCGRPPNTVPRGIYMDIYGLLDTEQAEHGLRTRMYSQEAPWETASSLGRMPDPGKSSQ